MKDSKLNNLLSIETYTENKFNTKNKTTKRTNVAKDVIQENAYVIGKDVLNKKKVEIPTGKGTTVKPVGKEVLGGSFKNTEKHASKGLNNLISLDDFTKAIPATKDKPTKRTGTAKDVLNEKKKAKKVKKEEECCDDDKGESKKGESKKGLTAAQKKLPEGLQKAILKRQKK